MIFKPAYTLFLKTGVVCDAGCITCQAGRPNLKELAGHYKESSGMMRPLMMDRIINYVKKQGRIISATHHYYNEPTLNPHIAELIQICHINGVYCLMSTNGGHQETLKEVLQQGLTNLIFSVSGWTQETHERSHKFVQIERVKESMRMTSDFIKTHKDFRGGRMFVRVSWHDYAYNEKEQPLMREFSESLGFQFTPYQTGLLPLEQAQARMLETMSDPDSPEHPGERDLRTKMKEAAKLCANHAGMSCDNQHRKLTIDSNGYLHNCCVKAHDANRRGLLFETDLEEFNRYRREEDPDCNDCIKHGWQSYAEQTNMLPNTLTHRLKRKAADFWKLNNFGGVFPGVSAKYSQFVYTRRQKR